MKKFILLACIAVVLGLSSCQNGRVSMERAYPELELRAYDLNISSQKSATVTVTRVLGIDFSRLFNRQTGGFSPMTVLGGLVESPDNAYAIRALIDENQGVDYDMIFYPKFVVNKKWYVFYSTTDVKVVARFASVKSE